MRRINPKIDKIMSYLDFAEVCYNRKPQPDGSVETRTLRGWFVIALVLILVINVYLLLKGGN